MDYRQRRRRADEFAGLVARQRERLAAIYADSLSTMEMLERKAAAFGRMRADYAALKISWGGVADYDGWFAGEMNNARLAAVSTYRKWLPGLRWRLNATGHEAFYLEIEQLAEQAEDVRNRMLERWNAESLMGGSTQSG
jgi:predicted aminopeptidase